MPATATPANTSNRHIVDQLADVRQIIKDFEKREAALKAEISKEMGAANSLGGDEFIASQRISSRKGAIDTDAMKAAGIDPDRFRKPDPTVITIVTERREEVAA